jgi:hypothetical protein
MPPRISASVVHPFFEYSPLYALLIRRFKRGISAMLAVVIIVF